MRRIGWRDKGEYREGEKIYWKPFEKLYRNMIVDIS